jgi:pimeloyl-ACP methyl ester carboxylesterase
MPANRVSFGGSLAAEYARHFPGRLNKVVLLAPGGAVLGLRTEFGSPDLGRYRQPKVLAVAGSLDFCGYGAEGSQMG